MIHSVIQFILWTRLNAKAEKHNLTMDILIQVNISGEESKFGISPDEIDTF